MEISGEQRFNAPRQVVWELLLDPRALQAALPGCERFEAVGPDSYELTLAVGLAAIKGSYAGNVRVADRVQGESYRLVVRGSSKPGSVQGDATVVLRDEANGTMVTYAGEIRAQGALAGLGSRLLGGTAKLMIGQFFKGMERQAADRAV